MVTSTYGKAPEYWEARRLYVAHGFYKPAFVLSAFQASVAVCNSDGRAHVLLLVLILLGLSY